MTEYTIVTGYQPSDLQRKVNLHLEEGWQLQGGVSVTSPGDGDWYAQAMTREIEEKSKL